MTIQNEVTLETLEAMLTSMNQYIREEVATKEEVREIRDSLGQVEQSLGEVLRHLDNPEVGAC